MKILGENSGDSLITPFTLVHAAFGAIAAQVGLSARQHLVLHLMFEVFENQTETGKAIFQTLDGVHRRIARNIFGALVLSKWCGDSLENSLADVAAGVIGHHYFY